MAMLRIDASDAERLAQDIARRRSELLPKLHFETLKAGRRMQAIARAGAPRGPHTKHFASKFYTRTKQSANGTEVSVETKAALGSIIVFGRKDLRSGPHDSPGDALAQVEPGWERAIMDAAASVI